MPSFGVISEGPTDFAVLKNVLHGFFKTDEGAPVVVAVQPKTSSDPGGWTLVMRALRQGDVRQALQFHDFVVVQIDTDVCEEKGFDVPRAREGRTLKVEELASDVRARLLVEMGSPDEAVTARMIFAIAVDELECWLLPLLFDRSEKTRSEKTTGCLKTANDKLASEKRPQLSAHDGSKKNPRAYEAASSDFRKKKDLVAAAGRNESLRLFVRELGAHASEPSNELTNGASGSIDGGE